MIQQTSLLAYEDKKEKARLRQLVMAVIMNDGPLSDAEIAHRLGFQNRQTVAPRRNELVKQGWVKECGTATYRGRSVLLWGTV